MVSHLMPNVVSTQCGEEKVEVEVEECAARVMERWRGS